VDATPKSKSHALDPGGDTGVTSAKMGIDGAFRNTVQIRPPLLTVPKIVLLFKRSSAACQQEQD
jgi:hypothetical protein